jgi:hypothetical protein
VGRAPPGKHRPGAQNTIPPKKERKKRKKKEEEEARSICNIVNIILMQTQNAMETEKKETIQIGIQRVEIKDTFPNDIKST